MDEPLPDDFDPYGESRVNYGIQNGNLAVIKWVAATAGTCFVGVVAYLFVDNANIRKEAGEDRKVLTEQFTLIRERLAAIETKQQVGCPK